MKSHNVSERQYKTNLIYSYKKMNYKITVSNMLYTVWIDQII